MSTLPASPPNSAPAASVLPGSPATATRLPAGSCNAHCHVFGPRDRFPYAADAPFVPAEDAPKEALYALNDSLGLARCVVVQSTCHGFDNAATADAVAHRPLDYRGIALMPLDVPVERLREMDRAGFRGLRFNYMAHLGGNTPVEALLPLAARLAPLGWHLQLHGDPALVLEQVVPALLAGGVPVPVVIDHIGRVDASLGEQQPRFDALRRLMEDERVWVKVSGMDRASRQGPPYEDAQPLARRLVQDHPERVLWGNDWPHPNHAGPVPDEALLVALVERIAPTPRLLEQLMVRNPARLYRFGDLS